MGRFIDWLARFLVTLDARLRARGLSLEQVVIVAADIQWWFDGDTFHYQMYNIEAATGGEAALALDIDR